MPQVQAPLNRRANPPPSPARYAYVRKMREYDDEIFGIYDEHGTPLAIAPTRELAFVTIRQHDLTPADVH